MPPLFRDLSLRRSFDCSALLLLALLCSGLHARISQYHPYSAFRSTSILLIEPGEEADRSLPTVNSEAHRCESLSPVLLLLSDFASRVQVSFRCPAQQPRGSSLSSVPLVPFLLFFRPPPSLPVAVG
jgi:hypothetical protein